MTIKESIIKCLRESDGNISSKIDKSAGEISGTVDRTKNKFKSMGVGDDGAGELAIASVLDAVKTEGVGDDNEDIGLSDIEKDGDDYEKQRDELEAINSETKKKTVVTKENLEKIVSSKLKSKK